MTDRATGDPGSRAIDDRAGPRHATARRARPTTPDDRGPPHVGHGAVLDLQRRAGNTATAARLVLGRQPGPPSRAGEGALADSPGRQSGPVTLQAADESPSENAVDRALRTREPGDVTSIDKKEMSGLAVEKKMDLVRILAYQGWVGPFDEAKIVEIWGTLTAPELARTGSREIVLFNHCMTVGAELDQLPNVKLMAGDFRTDVRSIALSYLATNAQVAASAMADLGIPAEGGEAVPPSEEQSRKLADAQRAAASVADLQLQMEAAHKVPVGYGPASYVPTQGDSGGGPGRSAGVDTDGPSDSGGGQRAAVQENYADVALYEPGKPPPFSTPEGVADGGFTLVHPPVRTAVFETLDALYMQATANVTALLGHHPGLMALSRTGSSGDVGAFAAEKPAAARTRIGGALRAVLDNIERARAGLDIAHGEIDPLDLQPIHRQMFQGQVTAIGEGRGRQDWAQGLPKLVAEGQIGDHEFGKVLAHMGLSTLSAAAFMIAPFTGGAGLAVLAATGVGAAAANAAFSAQEYDRLLSLSRTAVRPGTDLVGQGQVDAAKAQSEADNTELAMAAFTALTLGLGQIGRFKTLATVMETAADAEGLADLVDVVATLEDDVRMQSSMMEIDLAGPDGGPPVQRQAVRPEWEDFEIYAAGELQAGRVDGIPTMDVVVPGIHNSSGNGMDRFGLRRNRAGNIEIWHFEMKWSYLNTDNPDPKLWQRGGRMEFDRVWQTRAIDSLCESPHPTAVAARNAVRQYIAERSGRNIRRVPMSEVLDVLRMRPRGRVVLYREGVVPRTLLTQLADMLRRGRRVLHAPVRLHL